jgi:hypothetical protein
MRLAPWVAFLLTTISASCRKDETSCPPGYACKEGEAPVPASALAPPEPFHKTPEDAMKGDRIYLRALPSTNSVPIFVSSELAEKYIKARTSGDQRKQQASLAEAWTETPGRMMYIGDVGAGWVRIYPQIGTAGVHSGYTLLECIEYH